MEAISEANTQFRQNPMQNRFKIFRIPYRTIVRDLSNKTNSYMDFLCVQGGCHFQKDVGITPPQAICSTLKKNPNLT